MTEICDESIAIQKHSSNLISTLEVEKKKNGKLTEAIEILKKKKASQLETIQSLLNRLEASEVYTQELEKKLNNAEIKLTKCVVDLTCKDIKILELEKRLKEDFYKEKMFQHQIVKPNTKLQTEDIFDNKEAALPDEHQSGEGLILEERVWNYGKDGELLEENIPQEQLLRQGRQGPQGLAHGEDSARQQGHLLGQGGQSLVQGEQVSVQHVQDLVHIREQGVRNLVQEGQSEGVQVQAPLQKDLEQRQDTISDVWHYLGTDRKTQVQIQVQGVQEVQGIQEVQGVQEVQGIQEVQGVQEVLSVQEVQGRQVAHYLLERVQEEQTLKQRGQFEKQVHNPTQENLVQKEFIPQLVLKQISSVQERKEPNTTNYKVVVSNTECKQQDCDNINLKYQNTASNVEENANLCINDSELEIQEEVFNCEVESTNIQNVNTNDTPDVILPKSSRKQYECTFCDKKFSLENDVNYHKAFQHPIIVTNINNAKKTFCCRLCLKKFNVKKRLQVHAQVHRIKAVITCPHCSVKFNEFSRSYAKHLSSHGIESAKVSRACEVCGKRFSTEYYLKIHRDICSGFKKYACHICTKGFARENLLQDHICVHTGVKPYTCRFCEKSYSSYSILLNHARKVHNIKSAKELKSEKS